jgi:type III pantothenate kinase
MILLIDVGNTNTHLGLANSQRVVKHTEMPTESWRNGTAERKLSAFIKGRPVERAAFCSVVPATTPKVRRTLKTLLGVDPFELNAATIGGIGIDYPKPGTIGPDRLANALAAKHHFGSPAVVVDFGTAVTFDVVDRSGNYVGGIIAPGLAAMTDYLHEKTALLPRIKIRDTPSVIGKSTEEAMLVGAVHGYRGLIRELIKILKIELGVRRLPVIATGGYSNLFDRTMKEITEVEPLLTLEGLRLFSEEHAAPAQAKGIST